MTLLVRLLLASAIGMLLSACRIDDYFLYYPQPLNAEAARAVADRHPEAEEIEIQTPDGVQLHGWMTNHRDAHGRANRKPLVIYYSGNAEEVSWHLAEAKRFPAHAFVFMNYRGYGRSGGKPHERTLYADALMVFDQMSQRPEVDARRVLLWGRSLGTGVAVHVAAHRSVAGVVLVSPYDSITALAAVHQPLIKVFLTQPYDSIGKAPGIKAPMLALAAVRDTLIPVAHSERLVGAWAGPAKLVRLVDGEHQTLHRYPAYWQAVGDFLRGLRS